MLLFSVFVFAVSLCGSVKMQEENHSLETTTLFLELLIFSCHLQPDPFIPSSQELCKCCFEMLKKSSWTTASHGQAWLSRRRAEV